ncbi:MAG TPA: DegV family protein [Coriobacteriia bacterium]|nr:DegV family protein [Coriobacteriia bacterium]
MSVAVVTDSTNYIPSEELARLSIARVSLHVHDGADLRPETEIDIPAFYQRLADTREIPTSSQPSPDELVTVFRQLVEEGHEVVGAFMSSRMSGTVQAAELAATMVRETHPDARIAVVDTESNCMQEGYAVLAAAEKAAEGAGSDECVAAAVETVRRTRFLFSPHTLEYLSRGGRISGASALLGSLLQIVPILTVEHGETTIAAKVRTRAKAHAELANRMRADIERCGLRRAVVHGIVDMDEAARFARENVEPVVGHRVDVVPIGPVIGLHVGPAVGVVYETEEPLR